MNLNNTKFENGKFGQYGGQFVPETLMVALEEVEMPLILIFILPNSKKN